MKHMMLLILVLILLADLAKDGYLGQVTFCLTYPSSKTYVPSFQNHPGSGQTDFQDELASPNLPGDSCPGNDRPLVFFGSPTPQLMISAISAVPAATPGKQPESFLSFYLGCQDLEKFTLNSVRLCRSGRQAQHHRQIAYLK
jgi:hypothetical protein